jgi:hypothetical protein
MIERDAPFRALSSNQSIDQPQGSVSGYDDNYATDHLGYDLLWDPWTAQTAVSALSPLFHTSCQEETLRAPFKSAAAGVVLSASCRQDLPKPCPFSGSAHAIGGHRILDKAPLFFWRYRHSRSEMLAMCGSRVWSR